MIWGTTLNNCGNKGEKKHSAAYMMSLYLSVFLCSPSSVSLSPLLFRVVKHSKCAECLWEPRVLCDSLIPEENTKDWHVYLEIH